MSLDFITLYVVILSNKILMFIVWSVIYASYDRYYPALIWATACVVTALGGAVLSMEAVFNSLVPIYFGNGLVIFGFCLYWAGIRAFQRRPLPWLESFAIVGSAMAVLLVFTFSAPNPPARNAIYAICQSAPLLAAIVDICRSSEMRAGSRLAAVAFGLGILVHVFELTSNVLQVSGLMTRQTYGIIEPAVVLLVVFSGTLWNFGLVLMVTDGLYAALRWQAEHDGLTGLPNRRAADAQLDVLFAEADASGRAFSLMIVDLDRFKEVNDTHSHGAGDACLAHVAQTIRQNLGTADVLARTGGDEFTIFLPGQGEEASRIVAERLLEAVRANPFIWQQHALSTTLSIGLAYWLPGATVNGLSVAADAALYMAKARGRDQFAIAPRGMLGFPHEADEASAHPHHA